MSLQNARGVLVQFEFSFLLTNRAQTERSLASNSDQRQDSHHTAMIAGKYMLQLTVLQGKKVQQKSLKKAV